MLWTYLDFCCQLKATQIILCQKENLHRSSNRDDYSHSRGLVARARLHWHIIDTTCSKYSYNIQRWITCASVTSTCQLFIRSEQLLTLNCFLIFLGKKNSYVTCLLRQTCISELPAELNRLVQHIIAVIQNLPCCHLQFCSVAIINTACLFLSSPFVLFSLVSFCPSH